MKIINDTPFEQFRPMPVDVPINHAEKVDTYIDEMMQVCMDIDVNAKRFGAIFFGYLKP
jgi:hypothetical protein